MKEKLNEKDTFIASCLLLCVFYRFYMLKFNKGRLSLYFIGRQLISSARLCLWGIRMTFTALRL